MAESIFVKGENGSVIKMDLPLPDAIADRLVRGYLTRVANAEGDPYVETAGEPTVPTLPTERPAVSASKPEWVGWAVAQGMTPDEAEAATQQDLIEKFGAQPVAETPADPAASVG